jgi:hypothetical protein
LPLGRATAPPWLPAKSVRVSNLPACCALVPPACAAPCSCHPKTDGTYIIEFRMADGESLAISVPASETRVLKHFQARMPFGLFVPDVA